MQAVEPSAGADMRMGPGTIYGSLQRIEDAGLVRELTTPGDDRRRIFGLHLPAAAHSRPRRTD
jgi:DNA-binding PadR family transcriptional regulator